MATVECQCFASYDKGTAQVVGYEWSTTPFLGTAEIIQPSNADMMANLDRMMGAMALKENVQIAQMEDVKQMRFELVAQIEFIRTQIEVTSANAFHTREETKSLNERITLMVVLLLNSCKTMRSC